MGWPPSEIDAKAQGRDPIAFEGIAKSMALLSVAMAAALSPGGVDLDLGDSRRFLDALFEPEGAERAGEPVASHRGPLPGFGRAAALAHLQGEELANLLQ